jgi:hypothetical protein
MNLVIAVDYDGTLFTGSWDSVGEPIWPVIVQANRFCEHPRCEVILWTCREERLLAEAIKRCDEVGLRFDAVNMNTDETLKWNLFNFGRQGHTSGRKVYADLYVDDKSPGSIEHFLTLDPDAEWQKVKDRRIE